MADIKLVIKIDEEYLEDIKERVKDGDIDYEPWVAIANGIQLPKGHGRLGDLDALEQEMINGINAGNFEEGYETFAHINDMDDCVECVKYADTIIEADSESEDKE